VLGHALSLNLLGTYLSAVHGGDVNQREQFRLGEIEDADADFVGDLTARYGKRTARIMEDTISRLGEAETAILHMVGLFHRPAEAAALEALLAEPVISGLTEAFHGLTANQRKARWNVAVERLRKLKLLSGEDGHALGGLDAHPIVRAHFGDRLKARAPTAYAEACSRLYDHYRYQGLPREFCTPEAYGLLAFLTVRREHQDMIVRQISEAHWPEGWLPQIPPSLVSPDWSKLREAAALIGTAAFDDALVAFLPGSVEGMRPCFAAIAHGCASGRHQEAYSEVYFPRVLRGNENFIGHKLGALNASLAALASFFDKPWGTPAAALRDTTKARVLGFTAFALRALGRLREAVEPFEAGLKADAAARDWERAAIGASNVSELCLTLGDIAEAIRAARDSVALADTSGNAGMRMIMRTTLADALHQSGAAPEALAAFAEAEAMQKEKQPDLPNLYSLSSYRYSDFLLASGQPHAVIENYHYCRQSGDSLLTLALEELAVGRAHAALCSRPACTGPLSSPLKPVLIQPSRDTSTTVSPAALDDRGEPGHNGAGDGGGDKGGSGNAAKAVTHLDAAVDGLRRAGTDYILPAGLLARAAFRRSQGTYPAATTDLAEALDIASRGEMRLYLADIHLETARLLLAQFDGDDSTLRAETEAHIQAAADLIKATGYNRRQAELAALRACLDSAIPADILAPDRDEKGRFIWHDLVISD
jgi:tetratricopeptide (TPR) repeat protein